LTKKRAEAGPSVEIHNAPSADSCGHRRAAVATASAALPQQSPKSCSDSGVTGVI
jgi:hypothetical protein